MLGAVDGQTQKTEQTAAAATPVGDYARQLKQDLRGLPAATITGEITNFSQSKVQIYFELRDDRGGVPGTMWKREFEALKLPEGAVKVGAQVVVTGSPDYYEGGKNASPAFSFRATEIRLSGEGDLIARLAELRKKFLAEGLTERQKRLHLPDLPKRIGVITAEGGAARQDLLAGLTRRGWQGEIVWGFAPVQDRKAAPEITRILSDMAAFGEVETIVVCRGGGSLTDLWAFCDEDLCRTVALSGIPVISAVGHERDVTLIDDVAAVRASTPTHAADAVVGLDLNLARRNLSSVAERIARSSQFAVRDRVAPLAELAKGPGRAIKSERIRLNQKTREIRAAADRGVGARVSSLSLRTKQGLEFSVQRANRAVEIGLARNGQRPAELSAQVARRLAMRERELETGRIALRAHDPQRTLERGYARVEDQTGEPIVAAKEARRAGDVKIRFADDVVDAYVGASKRRRQSSAKVSSEFEQISMEGFDERE